MNSVCGSCLKPDCKSKCSACGEAFYCSTVCHKTDWAKHKIECGKRFTTAEERAAIVKLASEMIMDHPDWCEALCAAIPVGAVAMTISIDSGHQMRLLTKGHFRYAIVHDKKLLDSLGARKPTADEAVLHIQVESPDGMCSSAALIVKKK